MRIYTDREMRICDGNMIGFEIFVDDLVDDTLGVVWDESCLIRRERIQVVVHIKIDTTRPKLCQIYSSLVRIC